MNTSLKLAVLSTLLISNTVILNGCVTTRAQYNQERGIREDGAEDEATSSAPEQSSSVKSEDLQPEAAAVATPAPAPQPPLTPTTPGPYAPETKTAPTASTTAGAVVPAPTGSYTVEELRAELARLNGRVEELEHEKKLTAEENEAEKKKLQEQVAGLEKTLKESQPQTLEVPEGKNAFTAGKDAYFGALFDQAVQYMDQFLQKPENQESKDAPEAVYIRGESYFKMKQYKKAIVDFSKFSEKYQKSPYHPKALLRIAESFEALGMKDDAKIFYSDLSDKFPKTAEGKLAKKRLKKK